jgi:hypothetical protein
MGRPRVCIEVLLGSRVPLAFNCEWVVEGGLALERLLGLSGESGGVNMGMEEGTWRRCMVSVGEVSRDELGESEESDPRSWSSSSSFPV